MIKRLQRYLSKPIFQYGTETTLDTLIRHHRIVCAVIYPCGFSALMMLSSLAEGLILGFDAFVICLSIVSLLITTALIIPSIILMPWANDIESEIKRRGGDIPGGYDINSRVGKTTIKMILWAVVIVAAPALIRKLHPIFTGIISK